MKSIYVMGSINTDLVIECDTYPKQGETVVGKNFIVNSGGKGANQAVAVAKSGSKAVLLAAVGNDLYGAQNLEKLNQYGVDTSHVAKFDAVSSGIACVTVSNGDNRIILDLGANLKLTASNYEHVLKKANAGDIFVTQIETDCQNVVQGLKLAKQCGMTTVVNPAPANAQVVQSLLTHIDYLIPNEIELADICGVTIENIDEAAVAAKGLLDKGIKCVIVTLGANGCLKVDSSGYIHIPSRKMQAIDSTAAGDTFVGYFCAGLAEGQDTFSACKLANAAAAITVTKRGAQQSIPYRKEVNV